LGGQDASPAGGRAVASRERPGALVAILKGVPARSAAPAGPNGRQRGDAGRRSGGGGIRQFVRTHPWWQTVLLVTGFVALLSVFGALFIGFGRTPRVVETSAPVPSVDSPHFLAALGRLVNSPVDEGGTIEILNNGDEFLPALLESLRQARETINVLVYIWESGAFSDQVLDALMERQQAGVPVRVLLDGFGARKGPREGFRRLEDAGARIERFRTPRFGEWTRFHRRNHRRAIVIDGQVGFTGGMAIGDEWLGDARNPDEWRDMMFRVTGPLAKSLQAAFVHSWAVSSGEILIGPEVYPPEPRPDRGVERFIHHVHSPADDDQSMAYFYLLSVLAARERLYIAMPYFTPDPPLGDALRQVAGAGVDVRLLLPGPHVVPAFTRWNSQNHYDSLLEAGVRIFEYEPTFMHSKFVVVDGRWSVIGSPNLNVRSRQLDEENAFGILDADLGRRLEAEFLRDLQRSQEIHLHEWRRRSPWLRLVQTASRALDRQS
jgi:cardiolipin synthase A/B